MSTATLEKPVEQSAPPYKMPEVLLGQFVMYYPDNGVNEAVGKVAKVVGITSDLLTLEVGGNDQTPQSFLTNKAQVRHRTDPRLATGNQFIIRNGCWDYTPWEKNLRAEMAELKSTVAKLVADLGGPTTKGKKSE